MSVALAHIQDDTLSPATSSFYQAIQSQLNTQIGPIINATVVPVASNGQGDFPFNYLDPNTLDFNAGTYQFVSAQASPGDDGAVELTPGAFLDTLRKLFGQMVFKPSAGDQKKISTARQAAAQASTDLVQTYAGQYGPVTDAAMTAAAAAGWIFPDGDRFAYIVQVVVGGAWAGFSKPPGLSLSEMQNAENLQNLLPNMPADGGTVLSTVGDYLNALAPAISLLDQGNDATRQITQITKALANPQAGTNGVTTFDPNGVLPASVVPAYAISKSGQQIMNDLTNTSRLITVTASVSNESDGSKSVSIDGNAGISLSAEDGLIGFDGGTSFQYNMESEQWSGSEVDVTITYNGWSDVPVAPMPFQITGGGTSATALGWYAPQLLKQAYANWNAKGNAPSGVVFNNQPVADLSRYPTGDFNFLSTILISSYPTITLHYTAGDYATFTQTLATQTTGSVSVLGIPVASATVNTYSMEHHQNASNSDFTVTLTATPPTNVPAALVTAHVIGGVVTTPAV